MPQSKRRPRLNSDNTVDGCPALCCASGLDLHRRDGPHCLMGTIVSERPAVQRLDNAQEWQWGLSVEFSGARSGAGLNSGLTAYKTPHIYGAWGPWRRGAARPYWQHTSSPYAEVHILNPSLWSQASCPVWKTWVIHYSGRGSNKTVKWRLKLRGYQRRIFRKRDRRYV